jgi:hypothetical protein
MKHFQSIDGLILILDFITYVFVQFEKLAQDLIPLIILVDVEHKNDIDEQLHSLHVELVVH